MWVTGRESESLTRGTEVPSVTRGTFSPSPSAGVAVKVSSRSEFSSEEHGAFFEIEAFCENVPIWT